ncbi:MAG: SPFH/Band 7/PHB domain protein [Oscillospiraceae bacterium]|nr:SPFH/Band 7/PHB domain protein [Oscillospiraceae bacterium]
MAQTGAGSAGIYIIIAAIVVIFLIILGKNVVIVPQAHTFVIERLGAFRVAWKTGLHIKVPFIERVAKRVDLREQVYDFAPQPVITKDNVTVMVDTIVFAQVFDAQKFAYGVVNPVVAIEKLCATAIRNIFGEKDLDETLTSREYINTKMREAIDMATDPWGIKVTRVELRGIEPPIAIKEAMEKQMRAERERREQILLAEGTKESEVLKAQGEKQAAILRAEAEKEATILRADAQKKRQILEAEGEAEAILSVQKARADGLKMIKEAKTDEAVIRLEALSTFKEASMGPANKIIIPSDIQAVAGLVATVGELVKTDS